MSAASSGSEKKRGTVLLTVAQTTAWCERRAAEQDVPQIVTLRCAGKGIPTITHVLFMRTYLPAQPPFFLQSITTAGAVTDINMLTGRGMAVFRQMRTAVEFATLKQNAANSGGWQNTCEFASPPSPPKMPIDKRFGVVAIRNKVLKGKPVPKAGLECCTP